MLNAVLAALPELQTISGVALTLSDFTWSSYSQSNSAGKLEIIIMTITAQFAKYFL